MADGMGKLAGEPFERALAQGYQPAAPRACRRVVSVISARAKSLFFWRPRGRAAGR